MRALHSTIARTQSRLEDPIMAEKKKASEASTHLKDPKDAKADKKAAAPASKGKSGRK